MSRFPSSGSQVIEFQQKTKHIFEPIASTSSLQFLRDDFEEEKESTELRETPLDSVEKHLLTYRVARSIQLLLIGDHIATATQLTVLYDMELDSKFFQNNLIKLGGIEVLINLLEVKDLRCIIGALKVIEKLASRNRMRIYLTNLGIIPLLIALLWNPNVNLRIFVSRALGQLCKVQKPARYLRKEGGIPPLVECLDVDESTMYTSTDLLTDKQREQLALATTVTETLKELVKYPKSVDVLYRCGFVRLVKKATECCHKQLLVEVIELLSYCASSSQMRRFLETEGILLTLIQNLPGDDQRLRAACAKTIAECASDSDLSCDIVRMLGGLSDIVDMTKDVKQDPKTLAALTLAAAKLAQNKKNLKIMSENGLVYNLIKYFKFDIRNDEIISNVLEGLAECGRLEENRQVIANSSIINKAVTRLLGNNPRVLTSAAMCLGTVGRSPEGARRIMELDGLRMLFSVLQDENPAVTATALWALRPLIRNTADSAEEVRSIVGGLSLLTRLLSDKDRDVKIKACGLVAEIAQDEENLQILSDCGLVRALSECAQEGDEEANQIIAEAIAYSATLYKNAVEFGLLGVVPLVRNYLSSKNAVLHLQAMRALAALTEVPYNCVVLHESDGVRPVTCDVSAPWPLLASFATVVLRNMRRVALETEQCAIARGRREAFSRLQKEPKNLDKLNSVAFNRNVKDFYHSATATAGSKTKPPRGKSILFSKH